MIVSGYLLYIKGKHNKCPAYCGVEDNIFVPQAEHYKKTSPNFESKIPWLEELFPLYDKSLKQLNSESYKSLEIIENIDTARLIQSKVDRHSICMDILFVTVYSLDDISKDSIAKTITSGMTFVGYDIAYPGGDNYSAIYNGLLVNPSQRLRNKYYEKLNRNLLFSDKALLVEYLQDFKNESLTEKDSVFVVYEIWK